MAEIIDLRLTAMAHGGSALGRHEGRVLFVPYTLPGETVRVEIVEAHAHWAQAQLVEVLEPSPQRIEPPCPYFGPGRCGGCQYQQIAYEAQAELKRQIVIDQLARVGGLHEVLVHDIIGAAEPWGYRNQARFSMTPDGALGYPSTDGRRVVPVKQCPILDPLLDDLWVALDLEWPQLERLTLRCGSATGDLMAIFELDHYHDFDIDVDFPVSCVLLLADGEVVVLMGNPYYLEQVTGRELRIGAGSSFRANTAGAEALVALVQEMLAPAGHETLVDLGSGVGLLALALAGQVGRVIGVEADPGAAADFRHNTQGLDHVTLVEGPVQAMLPRLAGPVDLLVLDPPQAGAGKTTIAELARLAPARIAYVSCDPATLARDARLLAGHGYQLEAVQPVDLLPQTFHVESIALFAR